MPSNTFHSVVFNGVLFLFTLQILNVCLNRQDYSKNGVHIYFSGINKRIEGKVLVNDFHVLIGNEFTHTFRFPLKSLRKRIYNLVLCYWETINGILKTCYRYICYSTIHFVLNLPRDVSYTQLFCIGIAVGKDWPLTVHLLVADVDSTKSEGEKWRGEIHL